MLKVKEAAGSKCYVLTLNHSGSAVPEALLNASAPVRTTCIVLLFCSLLELFYTTSFLQELSSC